MIVGTAGHIDHGKTALVRALTGVETDRLAEEKARGISIDLGFAYWDAAPGLRIGFVDVPGHERFVRNMLAGASGIDAVLLVVAADDGIMPQTREHLAIVDLLGLKRGVVALTKSDKTGGAAIASLRREIADLIMPTALRDAAIVPVSSVTGEGLKELTAALVDLGGSADTRCEGRFRMPIDRSFTVAGAGTVVTGSIAGGTVAVGDTVILSPGEMTARVRSLHRQNQSAEQGLAGDRCALNLVGEKVTRDAVHRGMVAMDPSLPGPIERFDARLRLLPTERRLLHHWAPVRLHIGAAEIGARVALLQDDPLAPGSAGYAQLLLDHPATMFVRDRFVIRDTSASRTIGGGVVVDTHPPKRRRKTPARRAMLAALDHDDATRAVAAVLSLEPWAVDWPAFVDDRALSSEQAQTIAEQVAHVCAGRWLIAPPAWDALRASALAEVQAFHGAHPQLLGPGRLRVLRALQPRLDRAAASAVIDRLVEEGALNAQGGALRLPGHKMGLDRTDRALWTRIAPTLLGNTRFKPPRAGEIATLISAREFEVRRVMKAMAQQGELHEIAPDHFFPRATLAEVAAICCDIADQSEEGWFPAAALRDRLDNGRKVAIQLLEYFDRQGLTGRQGDLRRINPAKIDSFAAREPGAQQ